jgi:DNA modification methylase
MKPVGLVQYLLSNSTQPGEIVLDPFAGSGSTLIACHHENRVARLVELDPKYADVILKRFKDHTGIVPINQRGEPFDG